MFETDSEEEEEEVKDMTKNNIIPKKKTAFQVKGLGGGGCLYTYTYICTIHIRYIHIWIILNTLLCCFL